MEYFPKKYNPKDLRKRSILDKKKYINNSIESTFSPNILSSSKKLSYQDFFLIYLKDFFNQKNIIQNPQNFEDWINKLYEQLFIIYWNQLDNIFSSFLFFSKKRQTISQVWSNKLEKHIISRNKKYINANHKILDCYSSSNHKIYIPDSDLYIYILEQLRLLREKWKITNETKIWYRSFNLQTSIPYEKISWKKEKIPCYTLKYFVWTKAEALPVCIEDIDLCCSDVALLVHPKDKRYNKHIWKNAIIPLCNRQIPIIGDDNVNIAVNNWIKRICPCYDEESIELAKKYWLPTDIYVFDKEWLYTNYIHETAFIWQERKKYYNNIIDFMEDIWNLAEKWEKTIEIPYLEEINERLVPYKIDQLIINLQKEKEEIINQFLENNINYTSSNNNLSQLIKENNKHQENILLEDWQDKTFETNIEWFDITSNDEDENTNTIKQQIIEELEKYLPNYFICNSQIPFWWKIPLIKDKNWNLTFFSIEKDISSQTQNPIQSCFDFILLSLIRAWTLPVKECWGNNEYKLCEYEKFHKILSENEKKIKYLIEYFETTTWNNSDYNKFLKIIEDLTDENNSTIKDLSNLIKNCKFLRHEWNFLFVKLKWNTNDIINPDFIELCIPCYLYNKWIIINSQTIFDENEKEKIFKELLTQELLLSKTINKNLIECSYQKNNEFLGDRQLSKSQLEQAQWNIFSSYWENPIRLNFLINQTFDQKQILLNNIFLKQIWNSVRLCTQKSFLPEKIENCLNNQPQDFEDFDIIVLDKLKELYNERENVITYEDYINFFNNFKESTQNIFFSRYLEVQKINTTKNTQFVCSYFFNFLLTILYPLTPEFVHALQYISKKTFIKPLKPLELNRTANYNINILYNTFIKIKEMKIENNIKQHEPCNIFIKSNPSICELFAQYEQIFINHFHLSEINYFRLHEQTPLWYETFSNDIVTIWIQHWNNNLWKDKESLENIEKEIKNLDDKLNLLKERLPLLEWEQRAKAEEEYAKTKEEIETLTIKHSLLSSK